MDENKVEFIPTDGLKMEEGAEELMESALMEPYVRLAMAIMGHKDPKAAVAEISELPLEKRYVWRSPLR